ncbi:hypothetical protein BSKO_02700 [Bryopsis sp. KO-2023]|nr:hypothetical protein BSKO_02700 [Bryopsis sp. KO-2023]
MVKHHMMEAKNRQVEEDKKFAAKWDASSLTAMIKSKVRVITKRVTLEVMRGRFGLSSPVVVTRVVKMMARGKSPGERA